MAQPLGQGICGSDLDKALKQIRSDQINAEQQKRRKHLVEKAEAEHRVRVAVWIGEYLLNNPLPPRRLVR